MTEKCQRSFHRKHVEKTPEKSNFFYPTSRLSSFCSRFPFVYTVSVLEGKSNGIERVGGHRVFIIRALLDDHNIVQCRMDKSGEYVDVEKVAVERK